MKVIYASYQNVTVFESQVVALLNYLIESREIDKILLLLGIRYNEYKIESRLSELDRRIEVISFMYYPQYPFIERLTIASIKSAIRKKIVDDDYIIHVRNEILAYYIYKVYKQLKYENPKIIVDIRGAGIEQIMEYSSKMKALRKIKDIQRKKVFRSMAGIKNISVVSEALRIYIKNKICKKEINIKVNTTLAGIKFEYSSSVRREIRSELNITDNEIVLVVCTGGDHKWQNIAYTICELSSKGHKIFNLSRVKYTQPDVYNIYVPYIEVHKYLCAADIAVIWREKSITNKVSSPVKFTEYICCGLPVITNNSIDLVADYIFNHNCGKILNSISEINDELLFELRNIDRRHISTIGRLYFGVESIAHQYIEYYNEVLHQ